MLENNLDSNTTDEELVNIALKDNKKYEFLLNRYEAKLMRYIMRVGRLNQEDAKDILQEVFIKTYINLNNFDTSLKFSSWIYRISHNETVNFLRKNKNRTTVDLELDKVLIKTIEEDLSIEEKIDEKYFIEKIKKIIDNLKNKDYRDALILRYIEEKDYQEISDILKKPIGTVATILSRAKIQLKKELTKNNQIKNY